jgi:hypothetical protein
MPADLLALGRRAVAAEGWRWMPGMSNQYGDIVTYADNDGVVAFVSRKGYYHEVGADFPQSRIRNDFGSDAVPDLSDPATLGCLLALVREKHGEWAEIRHDLLGWFLWLEAPHG